MVLQGRLWPRSLALGLPDYKTSLQRADDGRSTVQVFLQAGASDSNAEPHNTCGRTATR